MPLYEYECPACGHRFEVIQRFADPPAGTCVACGKGPVHKLLSAPAVHFKGSGWYVTDYAKKGSGAAASETGAGDASKGAASDTKAADEKKTASPSAESKTADKK